MKRFTGREARATQKYLGYSYKKGVAVAKKIRGAHVDQAIRTLQFSPQQAARATLKVLKSAIANAVETKGMKAENLVVQHVLVNKATSYKRIKYRARGRADRMVRRNNHTTVVLGELDFSVPSKATEAASGES